MDYRTAIYGGRRQDNRHIRLMDILIKRITNKPVDSNCYVIWKSGNDKCIIVDPGSEDSSELIIFLNSNQLVPEYIILTHEHFDHIWGVNQLKDLFGTKIVCSSECAKNIIDAKKNLSLFFNQTGFEIYPVDLTIESIHNKLHWNNVTIEFIKTLGHSQGSISFYFNNKLFCGDLMIRGHKTVTKLPGGNKDQLEESMKYIFSKFNPSKTMVYSGHGDIFALDRF